MAVAAERPRLGVGIGWRPELAWFIERRGSLGFVEVIAENLDPRAVPEPLAQLRDRGVRVIPHGVGLSLGGADRPEQARLRHLAACAAAVGAPLVSEHIAFVRAGGLEAGHLLPVPRTRESLDVLVENVLQAQAALPVPLALENIAALLAWPSPEFDEAAFLAELVDRTGVLLLIDVANLYADAFNHGSDPAAQLARLPLDRLAYVHVAGGIERGGRYHDTHRHAVPPGVLDVLTELCTRTDPPGVMLERDGDYPDDAELDAELDAIASAMARGSARMRA
ncbi:MAG: DUF692 domain-containing protein [Egibacteraceae bacterium]